MLYQTNNPHGGDIYGDEIRLDFSANTNPFGTPQGVLNAVRTALEAMHRYPDPYCRKLVQAIAAHETVDPAYVLCGNGAAELIYAYCEAVRPKLAMELAPTFAEYSLGLERVGCRVERYVLRKENAFLVDGAVLDVIKRCLPDVLFLCNPNNPTGQLIEPSLMEDLLRLCAELEIRLFVDECFLDLTDGGVSLKTHLAEHPNLLILKAFTKSYGMAGIRLGYCLSADAELLTAMSRSTQPWNVSSLAQAAGVAALQESAFLEETKALIAVERPWLQVQLESLGYWVCPSAANYLLFHAPETLCQELRRKKIAIRDCDNYHGLGPGWYRIAVRTHEENQQLIQAMKEV